MRSLSDMNAPRQSGITTLMVLAFIGIFLMILGSITSFALEQSKYGRVLYDREQALASSEAGLEYYRWYLSHSPNDTTNGTAAAPPYAYVINDPETGALMGTAAIAPAPYTQCGVNQWIDITSVGKSNLDPGFPRTLFARYMQPSVAGYSYVLNSNVWAGSDRVITGPYFSNGGIRMDGSSNSTVSSAVSTWSCDASFGCSPSATEPGVFGSGSGSALWKNSVSSIDFAGVTAGLSNMKTYAKNNGGLYFPPASGAYNQRGYHLVFRSDGTVDVYRVTATTAVAGMTESGAWQYDYSIIASQTYVGNYAIPPSCSLIFVEDRAWVEGVIKGKVTVAAADFINTTDQPDAYLPNNITYAAYDGSAGLSVIAEGNVLIPLNSPDVMELHGIFVAENGSYGRNFYTNNAAYGYVVPAAYNSYVTRTKLTTVGTVVSNERTGTSWADSSGNFLSGYASRVDSFDQLQALAPPPFTPAASPNFKFIEWEEK